MFHLYQITGVFLILTGKKYVFDIRRTFREAYDHARRVLYAVEHTIQDQEVSQSPPDEIELDKADNTEQVCAQDSSFDRCDTNGCVVSIAYQTAFFMYYTGT